MRCFSSCGTERQAAIQYVNIAVAVEFTKGPACMKYKLTPSLRQHTDRYLGGIFFLSAESELLQKVL